MPRSALVFGLGVLLLAVSHAARAAPDALRVLGLDPDLLAPYWRRRFDDAP